VAKDAFGAALMAAGVSAASIAAWSVDPQVAHSAGKGSCFDLLEDMDAADCINTCLTIKARPHAVCPYCVLHGLPTVYLAIEAVPDAFPEYFLHLAL